MGSGDGGRCWNEIIDSFFVPSGIKNRPAGSTYATNTSLRKAAALEPSSAYIFRIRAYLSFVLGKLDEVIKLYQQAVALDPLRTNSHLTVGQLLRAAGRYHVARITSTVCSLDK